MLSGLWLSVVLLIIFILQVFFIFCCLKYSYQVYIDFSFLSLLGALFSFGLYGVLGGGFISFFLGLILFFLTV